MTMTRSGTYGSLPETSLSVAAVRGEPLPEWQAHPGWPDPSEAWSLPPGWVNRPGIPGGSASLSDRPPRIVEPVRRDARVLHLQQLSCCRWTIYGNGDVPSCGLIDDESVGDARIGLDDETGHHVPITERDWDLDLLHRKVDQDAVLPVPKMSRRLVSTRYPSVFLFFRPPPGSKSRASTSNKTVSSNLRLSSITSNLALLPSAIASPFPWSLVRSA